jgi:hypothetical protein
MTNGVIGRGADISGVARFVDLFGERRGIGLVSLVGVVTRNFESGKVWIGEKEEIFWNREE